MILQKATEEVVGHLSTVKRAYTLLNVCQYLHPQMTVTLLLLLL